MTTEKRRGTQKANLRSPDKITLEDISHYEWEVYRKVSELIEALKNQQKEAQPDSTTVRAGKLVVMRGKGYLKSTPDFEKIWGVLDKEEYAPKKPVGGAIKIDFLS